MMVHVWLAIFQDGPRSGPGSGDILTAMAAIIAILVSIGGMVGGAWKFMERMESRALDRARAEVYKDEAAKTIEAKNVELEQLGHHYDDMREENRRLQTRIDKQDAVITRLSGKAKQ